MTLKSGFTVSEALNKFVLVELLYELFVLILAVIYSVREQITVRSIPTKKLLEKMILEAFLMVSMVRAKTVNAEIKLGNVYFLLPHF